MNSKFPLKSQGLDSGGARAPGLEGRGGATVAGTFKRRDDLAPAEASGPGQGLLRAGGTLTVCLVAVFSSLDCSGLQFPSLGSRTGNARVLISILAFYEFRSPLQMPKKWGLGG